MPSQSLYKFSKLESLGMDMTHPGPFYWITPVSIIELAEMIQKSSGLACCECLEFYSYAEANMRDGRLCCYSCRQTHSWKYGSMLRG